MSDDEIERLRRECRGWYDQNTSLIQQRDKVWDENKQLRIQLNEVAAFLDRLAGRIEGALHISVVADTATDCRTMAERLRK